MYAWLELLGRWRRLLRADGVEVMEQAALARFPGVDPVTGDAVHHPAGGRGHGRRIIEERDDPSYAVVIDAARDDRSLPLAQRQHPHPVDHHRHRIVTPWRAGCGESRKSGSEGGDGKTNRRKPTRRPVPDPTHARHHRPLAARPRPRHRRVHVDGSERAHPPADHHHTLATRPRRTTNGPKAGPATLTVVVARARPPGPVRPTGRASPRGRRRSVERVADGPRAGL